MDIGGGNQLNTINTNSSVGRKNNNGSKIGTGALKKHNLPPGQNLGNQSRIPSNQMIHRNLRDNNNSINSKGPQGGSVLENVNSKT